MSPSLLKWIAGVASGLCGLAIIAMLTTWADVRQMKENQVKAERIATLEADVASLKAEDLELKESIRSLWRVRGNRPE